MFSHASAPKHQETACEPRRWKPRVFGGIYVYAEDNSEVIPVSLSLSLSLRPFHYREYIINCRAIYTFASPLAKRGSLFLSNDLPRRTMVGITTRDSPASNRAEDRCVICAFHIEIRGRAFADNARLIYTRVYL